LPGRHDTIRPQCGYCFTYDSAAHTHRRCHLLLGWKARTGRQLCSDDFGGDTLGDFMKQFPSGPD